MQTFHVIDMKKPELRRALKEAARQGGVYEVQIDLYPPTVQDAAELVAMARGVRPREIEASRRGRYYEWIPGKGGVYHSAPTEKIHAVYAPDPEYLARMESWAARVADRG